jgi:hypothetical protein
MRHTTSLWQRAEHDGYYHRSKERELIREPHLTDLLKVLGDKKMLMRHLNHKTPEYI